MQNVFILGASGNVGSELVRQIQQLDAPHLKRHHNPTRIVGLANSRTYLFNAEGIDLHEVLDAHMPHAQVCEFIKKKMNSEGIAYTDLSELLQVAQAGGYEHDLVFIDVTAGKQPLLDFQKLVITKSANKVVTANKNPVALSSMEDFRVLTADRSRYGFRASVMAGADTVTHLTDLYDISEHVISVEGSLSGSLAYICSELEKGKHNFSSILNQACKLQYTEPDPREDLCGLDVARKLVIIARCLNLPVMLSDVKVNGFLNLDAYDPNASNADFLSHVTKEDQSFKTIFANAKANGEAVRYVARLENTDTGVQTTVGLRNVSRDSALGSLKGSANKICIETTKYSGGKEYVIQAPGAGVDVTAAGIRRDLLAMLPHRLGGSYQI